MKINTKQPDRTLHAYSQGDGSVILIERERYLPTGYSKCKWEESRIRLTVDEIDKLAKIMACAPQDR